MKKIIVAGAGHGGITAAAYLAKQGYSVEVFEKRKREELGYDWHDTIANNTFEYAGIKVDQKDYTVRKDSTFFPPSLETQVSIDIDPSHREYSIDRKVLYKYLIDNALDKGVVFHFNVEVLSALVKNNKVAGIVTAQGEKAADFVIDATGLYSPLIKSLPQDYNIKSNYGENDIFWAYRAYYNLVPNAKIINPDRFNFYFMFEGIKGLAWFKENEGLADIIIGAVQPLDNERLDYTLEKLRKAQPCIGYELIRGGYAGDIPLKSTLPLIVGNNFALVGDSASMPIPMNGSGITNSIIAGKMLADTLINAKKWDKKNIWDYQVKYFTEIGSKMISIYILKNFLLGCTQKELNFLFGKGILGKKELGAGAVGQEIKLDKKAILDKLKKGWQRPLLLLRMKGIVKRSKNAKQAALDIPKTYEADAVNQWIQRIETFTK
jgi:flavin-dependent dehydrogenase